MDLSSLRIVGEGAAGDGAGGLGAPGDSGEDALPDDLTPEQAQALLQQLLQASAGAADAGGGDQQPLFRKITPEPGICIKTESDKGEKLFVNLCHHANIPDPPSLSDEELAMVVASGDSSKYRVPTSLGPPRAEVDKAGRGCTAIDAIISSAVFEQLKRREGMREFLIELIFCTLEAKHNFLLSRDYKILKNRKHVGMLAEQMCRVKSIIQAGAERKQQPHTQEAAKPRGALIEELEAKVPEPSYALLREPEQGRPEFLRSAKSQVLDVGEDRLVLHVHPNQWHLDFDFEWPVVAEDVGAQFDRKTRVLTVTCPVQPAKEKAY